MKSAWKTLCVVAALLVAVGAVLVGAGYCMSGFDARVFSAQVDRGKIVLGGEAVPDDVKLPLLSWIAEAGSVDYQPAESSDTGQREDAVAPSAPDAPGAPSAPDTPATL